MKKYYKGFASPLVGGLILALLAPVSALAANTDVTLDTTVVLSVNGITLDVSGSTASLDSITVNATDFSATLSPGSTFQVSAPNLNQFSASTRSGISKEICNASQSLLGYAPLSDTVTVTITPSTALCSDSGSGGSAPSPSSSSSTSSNTTVSSGGGGSTTVSTPATTETTPAETTTTTTTTTAEVPAVTASGLSSAQIQSILGVLASFDADASVVAKVKASLEGTATSAASNAPMASFTRDLQVGSTGDDAKVLQQYLNAHGYTIATTGAGSSGSETTKFGALTKAALIKLQKANGITPAAGYFGPKTRAYLEANP